MWNRRKPIRLASACFVATATIGCRLAFAQQLSQDILTIDRDRVTINGSLHLMENNSASTSDVMGKLRDLQTSIDKLQGRFDVFESASLEFFANTNMSAISDKYIKTIKAQPWSGQSRVVWPVTAAFSLIPILHKVVFSGFARIDCQSGVSSNITSHASNQIIMQALPKEFLPGTGTTFTLYESQNLTLQLQMRPFKEHNNNGSGDSVATVVYTCRQPLAMHEIRLNNLGTSYSVP